MSSNLLLMLVLGHLRELVSGKVKNLPVVNQIQIHPHNFNKQKELLEWCKQHDVIPQAYSIFGGGEVPLFAEKEVLKISKKHNTTPAHDAQVDSFSDTSLWLKYTF